MPTVVLPGIGATIRTLGTARAIARSSARLMILRHAQAGLELDLELGDHRPGIDLDHADLVAEIEQGPLQQHRPGVDLGLVLLDREGRRRLEQLHRRELERRARLDRRRDARRSAGDRHAAMGSAAARPAIAGVDRRR